MIRTSLNVDYNFILNGLERVLMRGLRESSNEDRPNLHLTPITSPLENCQLYQRFNGHYTLHSTMVSLYRTFRNIQRGGLRAYLRNMLYIGDAKYGRLVGTDVLGNKYYEEETPNEEIYGRSRWVDYKQHDFNASRE